MGIKGVLEEEPVPETARLVSSHVIQGDWHIDAYGFIDEGEISEGRCLTKFHGGISVGRMLFNF